MIANPNHGVRILFAIWIRTPQRCPVTSDAGSPMNFLLGRCRNRYACLAACLGREEPTACGSRLGRELAPTTAVQLLFWWCSCSSQWSLHQSNRAHDMRQDAGEERYSSVSRTDIDQSFPLGILIIDSSELLPIYQLNCNVSECTAWQGVRHIDHLSRWWISHLFDEV